jgi:pimeloyl-ACP methyl ester carboxylesterase
VGRIDLGHVSTFVLVHGAMHGGWCWDRVAPLLEARGHEVHTPTLAGQGDRRAELRPEIGLTLHANEIADLVRDLDHSGVVLVGHSYGGMVITQACERTADRVAGLVYVDGWVPRDGQSLLDTEPPTTAEAFRRMAEEHGDGWRIPAADAPVERWGYLTPADKALARHRLVDLPLACFTEPVRLSSGAAERLPRAYVAFDRPPMSDVVRPFRERAERDGWPVVLVDCGHAGMLTDPPAVAVAIEAAWAATAAGG